MITMLIKVESYSGYRADERPVRFVMSGRTYEVIEVEDRWYSPQAMYFRVVASDGNRYVLCHDEELDLWSLEAFRARGDGAREVEEGDPPSPAR
jgi:uncharacterized protein (UPF0128 family)